MGLWTNKCLLLLLHTSDERCVDTFGRKMQYADTATGKIFFRIDDPVDIDLLCMETDDEKMLQVEPGQH